MEAPFDGLLDKGKERKKKRNAVFKHFADRKCQVRLNRARISAPNDSSEVGGGEAGWGGETLKWSKGGLAAF